MYNLYYEEFEPTQEENDIIYVDSWDKKFKIKYHSSYSTLVCLQHT